MTRSQLKSQPDPEADIGASMPPDRALRLPAHCGTVAVEDIRVRLVLAADLDGGMEIDASEVESIGQAALQILIAARREAVSNGQGFAIIEPSPAFVDRVTRCRLADEIGLIQKDERL